MEKVKKLLSQVEQLKRDMSSWKVLLELMRAENSHLKTRLADFVSTDMNAERLSKAEDFQNRSIRKDELINLVKKDIYDFNSWLLDVSAAPNPSLKEIARRQNKLKAEVKILDDQFKKLQCEFNIFLSETS